MVLRQPEEVNPSTPQPLVNETALVSSNPGTCRYIVLTLGGEKLLDWLVSTCCDDPSKLQAEAERALVQLMAHGTGCTAAKVLSHPKAVPQLLSHIASGNASDELMDALEVFLCGRKSEVRSHELFHCGIFGGSDPLLQTAFN